MFEIIQWIILAATKKISIEGSNKKYIFQDDNSSWFLCYERKLRDRTKC